MVEELPLPAEPVVTDTSAMITEEPALSQVGHGKKSGFSSNGAAPAGIVSDGRYVVQVSVFKSRRMASQLVEKLAAQGYPAYVAEVENPTADLSGTYHRVRVGTFRTLGDARSFGENTVKSLGYDFWVDKKSMDNVGMREGGSGYEGGSSGGYSSPASSYSSPSEPSTYSPVPTPSEPEDIPSTPTNGDNYSSPPPETTSPSTSSWESSEPATPSEPSSVTPTTPEPPPPASTSGWGDENSNSAPADTATLKLDDW